VARNETGYAVLLSDADGVVVETLAEPGQVVTAGQVVVRVARAGRREAVIQLPETLRPAIGSIGQASLYGNGLAGPAKLRQLSDAANPHTRTFEARYVLEGRLANAPLGSTISIHIPNGLSAPQLHVPIGALFDAGKGPGVWLVEGETPRVTWRPVQVAGLGDEAASVVGELKAGDRVVALGAHLLHEGEQVRLTRSEAVAPVAVKGGE
jgi:RND family efflux transporter MFP subunit